MDFVLIISGLVVAIGGAIKDSRWEGFKPVVFFRSPAIGLIFSLILPSINYVNIPLDALWFFGGIGLERSVVEFYKLVRKKKPSKFDFGEWA